MVGRKHHWRIVLALTVIFLAGGVIGFTMGLSASKRRIQTVSQPEAWSERTLKRLDGRLSLTPEQREEIVPLLKDTTSEIHRLRRQTTVANFQQMRAFYRELEPILTEEQKKRLMAATEGMREKSQKFRPQWEARQGSPNLRPREFPAKASPPSQRTVQ